jgi:hypothetical protein
MDGDAIRGARKTEREDRGEGAGHQETHVSIM